MRAHARALPHDIIIRYTVLAELEPKQVEPGSMNLRLGTNFCGDAGWVGDRINE